MLSLADIEQLFARHGAEQYSGEPVTQLEHALQTAHLAEQSEAGDELVTACLLHDLGHLLYAWSPSAAEYDGRSPEGIALGLGRPGARASPSATEYDGRSPEGIALGLGRPGARAPQGETPTLRGIDDMHQYYALPFLRGLFPDEVLDAIKLHVDAKRYLCQIDAGYYERLSDDSKRSLALQGGVFDAQTAAAFLGQPGARDAVTLRRWDDFAKQRELETPSLAHFLDRAAACALAPAR